jgi:hypothetical protein
MAVFAGALLLSVGAAIAAPASITATAASEVAATTATLEAAVNPNFEATTSHFEYGLEDCSLSSCASTPATELGEGVSAIDVTAEISDLQPGTTYHYRAVATNSSGTTEGPDQTFTTLAASAPTIPQTTVSAVALTTAVLEAKVNPQGEATTSRFEYGLADCSLNPCTSTTVKNVGSGGSTLGISTEIVSLQPGTTYHFRAIATNGTGTANGPDRTFTTYAPSAGDSCPNQAFRVGASANLPDCRVYEMVSPVEKNGGDITSLCQINCFRTSLIQATPDGSKITYSSYKAFGDTRGSFYSNQYIATRGGSSWATHAINPLQPNSIFPIFDTFYDLDIQIKAFTPDLSATIITNDARPALTPDAGEDKINIYSRDNTSDTYNWLAGVGKTFETRPEILGISEDGSHVLFNVNEALTSDAAPTGAGAQVYDYSGGELHLVSVLPGGTPKAGASVGSAATTYENGRDRNVQHAVSEDGSRVFWTDANGYEATGTVYVRINNTETVNVSGLTGADGGAKFLTASTDGSTAIVSRAGELYSVDVDAETATPIAAGVDGLLGASDDASYVYFVSKEDLALGASAGERNLYLYHDGAYRLIAILSPTDTDEPADGVYGYNVVAMQPYRRPSRVTPDGHNIAFQSVASLTGYDNRDVKNGEPNVEVFTYDADADRLICASCNPSGARPDGEPLEDYDRANYSPATNNGGPGRRWTAAWLQTAETQLYFPRDLSEDGNRLFFNAFDALVPQDTNGKQDVYQWEAEGSGTCHRPGGCISLISTGESPKESEFIDASASGSDVYFKTFSSLDPQDPGLLDIYDARVGGGFQAPAIGSAPCEGDACQSVPAAPNDPTPASAAYNGPGNVKEAVKKKKHKKHKKHMQKKKKRSHKGTRPTRHATHRNG